jgi:hypothetical protein
MAQAKTPRTPKTTSARSKKVKPVNGNGHTTVVDIEAEIRVRAYELYEQRAGNPGSEHDDWLVAEQEVKAKHATAGN